MDIKDPDFQLGLKATFGEALVPIDAQTAILEIDSAWHQDPDSIAVWGLDVSSDGGQTWKHWCTVTRPGGQALTDGGEEADTFDVSTSLFGFDDKGEIAWDIRGDLMRPFFGALGVGSSDLKGNLRFE